MTTPTRAADVVGVFDANYRQVFPDARSIKATVKEEAKVMEHPLEDGSSIVDHKIILPIEVELSMVVQSADFRSVYDQIKRYYLGAELLSVQTRTGVYNSMVIQGMPHDETPDFYDTISIALKLKEVKLVTAQFGTLPPRKVKRKEDSSTVKRGEQQKDDKSKQSVGTEIADKAKELFGFGKKK